MSTLIGVGLASEVSKWEQLLGITMDDLEPMPAAMVAAGRAASALDLVRAVDAFAAWSRQIAAATGAFDVLLSPTMAILPPLLGTLSGDQPLEQCFAGWGAMCGFAMPFDVSGQPAISLPLHWSESRPADRRPARRRLRPRRPALPPLRAARAGPPLGRPPPAPDLTTMNSWPRRGCGRS